MKPCSTCQELKPFSAFNVMRRAPDGRQARCRDCCKAWYAANSDKQKAAVMGRNKRHRHEIQRWLEGYLREHPCVDCGEENIRCLDFDHRPDETKVMEIGKLLRHSASLAKIKREIEKCDVRCANCHRRKTAERASWWRQSVYEESARQLRERSAARLAKLFA